MKVFGLRLDGANVSVASANTGTGHDLIVSGDLVDNLLLLSIGPEDGNLVLSVVTEKQGKSKILFGDLAIFTLKMTDDRGIVVQQERGEKEKSDESGDPRALSESIGR